MTMWLRRSGGGRVIPGFMYLSLAPVVAATGATVSVQSLSCWLPTPLSGSCFVRSPFVCSPRGQHNDTLTTVAAASGKVDDGTPSLSLLSTTTKKRTALQHPCSPPLMDGCCVAHSVVCRPICNPPLSSSWDCQHFLCRLQSPITIPNFRQPLSCHSCPSRPSPLPLPSMDGCCVLCLPSSTPTEPPS